MKVTKSERKFSRQVTTRILSTVKELAAVAVALFQAEPHGISAHLRVISWLQSFTFTIGSRYFSGWTLKLSNQVFHPDYQQSTCKTMPNNKRKLA